MEGPVDKGMALLRSSRVGSALLEALDRSGKTQVAILGMAKNVGKTTVTVTLLRELALHGRSCSVVSIGRDGEAFDALDDRPKPRIPLGPGMIALVSRSQVRTLASCEVLAAAPLWAAAGELALIRAHVPLEVELQGLRSAAQMRDIVEYVRKLSGEIVIIDGALDRIAGGISSDTAIILATGAIVDRRLSAVVGQTELRYAHLALEQGRAEEGLVEQVGVVDEVAAGLILAEGTPLGILVPHCLQITLRAFARLRHRRVVRVAQGLEVIACSSNAIAPAWAFEPEDFAQLIFRATGCMTVDCLRDTVIE